MNKPADTKGTASIKEVTISNMLVIEALVDLLIGKGVIAEEELLKKVEEMRARAIQGEARI